MSAYDLLDSAPIEYVTEAAERETYSEVDDLDTVAEAITFARIKGFDISLEEFEDEGYEEPEEAFWEEFLNRYDRWQRRQA